MREILFRGRVNNGEWVEGMMMAQGERVAQIGTFIDYGTHVCCGSTYAVIPETVGQYTGLTDKNGKKIFEGDIVKATISKFGGGYVSTIITVALDDYESMYEIESSAI